MEIFAVVGAAMMAMMLAVVLRELKKEYAVLLSVACCALLLLWAISALTPVLDRLLELARITQLDTEYGEILLKALGISICTQLAADACRDAGESAIGSKVELCGRACVVLLSLPMFQEVLSLAGSMFAL
jgi:stage III sporulation protein AD